MRHKIYMLFPGLLFIPEIISAAVPAAQENAPAAFNAVLVGLVLLIVVLTFAIAVLANVLKNLAYAYRDKIKQQKKSGVTPGKTLLSVVFFLFVSVPVMAADATGAAPQVPEVIAGIKASQFYMLAGLIVLQLLIVISLTLLIRILVKELTKKTGIESVPAVTPEALKKPSFWNRFHRAVEVEKEADILLDHEYDGIRELDNSLPPWWKYSFYLTIVISVVYMWYYHWGGNGPSSYDEYAVAVQKGEEEKALYLAKSANNVDENTVKMGDPASILAGEKLYQSVCAACHAADGGGSVGPNLADAYWLHGGSISDVFKSIKYGWPDKGMKSWNEDFSPKQIADISSFIMSLQGTTPAAPKEKQGELYTEPLPGNAGSDTTSREIARR